jgi:benzoyl-CoA reductase/2-hydroxyglutaryl-CoA dehydratase subunit BcrC/BadD/HgdB
MPYWDYERDGKYYDGKTVPYVIDQYKALISWLEKHTNQKFDPQRFQHTMNLVNQARQNIWEFNELLKTVPCPVPSEYGSLNFGIMSQRSGSSVAVTATKYLRDEAANNAKAGIAGVPDEKIRIAWPYIHIFHDPELLEWLANEFKAVVIMDFLGYYQPLPHDVSSLESSFESLALGALDTNMVGGCRGPTEYYLDWVVNYVKDYKIDCCIFPMHFACKHTYPITRVTSEAVREETGVPSLIFGCDSFDSREVTSEMIRAKISDFLTQVVQ